MVIFNNNLKNATKHHNSWQDCHFLDIVRNDNESKEEI